MDCAGSPDMLVLVKLLISYWPFCFYHFYWYLSAATFLGFLSRIESLLHFTTKNIEYVNYTMIYCIWSQECIFLQNKVGMRISCTETLVVLTGHLDTGFSWFPYVYKRMQRWFPSFQVATTCLSCSPPDLNFLITFFIFVYM